MKVVLVYPPLGIPNDLLDITGDVPPLGLMDIGTQLLVEGHRSYLPGYSLRRRWQI